MGKKLFIILILFISPFMVLSQGVEELEIIVSPKSPKANQNISLTVISNVPGLNNSSITWSKNGVVEKRGVGQITHMTKMGEAGKSVSLSVSVTKPSGLVLRESVTVRPADVYLIWEADSYTPVFYRGKALPSHQSNVRVIAVHDLKNSNGSRLNSESLVYEWSLNGRADRSQSGVGRDVFNLKGSLISRPITVSLFVSNSNKSISARKNIDVNFTDPEILIYKENPLTGIKSNQSIKDGYVSGNESIFIAEPFYFPEQLFNSNSLEYEWFVDRKKLDESNKRREVTFTNKVIGESSVSVKVVSPFNLLQRASTVFKVIVQNNNE